MFDQGEVARYFVDGLLRGSEPVRHAVGEQPGERIFVEAHRLPGAGKSRQQSRSAESLTIDHQIVLFGADLAQDLQQCLVFRPLFIPNQHFPEVRMVDQQFFVAFAQQEINLCARVKPFPFFHQRRRQHDITDESGLDDQNFHNRVVWCKLPGFQADAAGKRGGQKKKCIFFLQKTN